MSASVGVVEFFIVEASEYLERLDGLLAAPGTSGPDDQQLARTARALRGSATMSRQQGIADIAAGLERVARALGGRTLRWDPALSAAMVAAVDDLRILLRNVRDWSTADDARVHARTLELYRIAPPPVRGNTPPAALASGSAFLASETTEVSRALEGYLSAPSAGAVSAVTERVRALRGVADVREMAPLPEVLEGVENVLKSLALAGSGPANAKQLGLLSAAVAVLRRSSRDIAARGRPDAELPEFTLFAAAAAALAPDGTTEEQIVPITQLFHDDSGPHVVSAAVSPPTSAAERFRLEVVSLAEHLRRAITEAHASRDREQSEHTRRPLRKALRALESAADSFSEQLVARFAGEWSVRATEAGDDALAALDAAAALLADPDTRPEELARTLVRLGSADSPVSRVAAAPDADIGAPQLAGDAASAATTRLPLRTPTGQQLHDFLQDGIAGFRELEREPLSQPVSLIDEEIVPVEQLLYRGRSALERAAELRAELLSRGGPPSREAVDELFDLIDLALTE